MSAGESEASTPTPIMVLDELQLKPGMLDPFLEALESRYRPGAEARGQKLLHTWVTPPTETAGIGLSVLLVWELAGVPGFWQMRSQNATPEVTAWWSDCEAFIESRTRRFAVGVDALAEFEDLGRLNA
jgi:hypothetical protein